MINMIDMTDEAQQWRVSPRAAGAKRWRASVPTSRLPLRGRMVSGSLRSTGRDERLLVRGQADACPSRRRSRRHPQNLCVSALNKLSTFNAICYVLVAACAVAAVACIVGCSSGRQRADNWQQLRQAALERRRVVIYNNDGNEPVLWPTNQPFSVDYFIKMRTAVVAGSQVDSIFYCPISSGFGFLTADIPSADLKTRPVGGVEHLAAYTNMLQAFIDHGTDPVREVGKWCRANQVEFFISLRVNDTHDMQADQTRLGPPYDRSNWAFSPFKAQNPHMLMGSYTNRPPFCNWSAVDFTHREVRERFFRMCRELCEMYDLDGLDLDFFRHPQFFRSVAWGGTASDEERGMLTDVMRRLRDAAEVAGKCRGRPILLSVRVPDSVAYCRDIGIELDVWLREGLIDMVIGSGYWQSNPWNYLAELCRGLPVKCYASLDESRLPQTEGAPIEFSRRSVATYRGQAMAARQAGLDGVMYFNMFNPADVKRKMWGCPDTMRLHDKVYPVSYRGHRHATRYCKSGNRHVTLRELSTRRPSKLKPGATEGFSVWVGDDFEALRRDNIKPSCELLLHVAVPAGQDLRVAVNGHEVVCRKSEQEFRRYEVKAEHLNTGENRLKFTAGAGSDARAVIVLKDAVLSIFNFERGGASVRLPGGVNAAHRTKGVNAAHRTGVVNAAHRTGDARLPSFVSFVPLCEKNRAMHET